MKQNFRLASITLNSQDNLQNNQIIIENAICQASSNGARLIVLPENACCMGYQHTIASQSATILSWYQRLARRYDVHLVAGTLPMINDINGQTSQHGKYHQSSFVIDNLGAIVARYDKVHLFCAKVADNVGRYDEGRTFVAGNRLVVAHCTIDGVRVNIGMMICFDIRFAIMAHQLRRLGADLLVAPSAFTYETGKKHWQSLLQARALDSQCMMIGSAQEGQHSFSNEQGDIRTRRTWGHGMIVDADGQIVGLSTTVQESGFDIAYATFDKDEQEKIRQHLPIFDQHRSNEIYQFD